LLVSVIGVYLKNISSNAFRNYSKFQFIKIYSLHFQSLSNDAFVECTNLANFIFLENNCPISLSETNFTEASLSDVYSCQTFFESDLPLNLIISTEITFIEDYKYFIQNDIFTIEFHSNIISIGKYAFAFCEKLSKLNIPSSVSLIDDSSFFGCYNLLTVIIESNNSTIGKHTFSSCSKLTTVHISSGISSI
jgi:hypothetical protein